MRVLVELLDKDPIANVLGPCIFSPEIVVYLCDIRDSTFFKESAIYRLFKRRKMKTSPRFYYFDATNPGGIRKVLRAVARDYPGCVIDFTGGRDLVLLAAGVCHAELNLPGFYIDMPTERFINVRGCEHLEKDFAIPNFTADDILAMAGATVHGDGHYHVSGFSDSFEHDALAIYEIVQKNPKAWGEFVAWLQKFCSGTANTQMSVEGMKQKSSRNSSQPNRVILKALQGTSAVDFKDIGKNRIEIIFKSPLHRKCLLIEGVWLELFCYFTAKNSNVFNDVRTSIVVDWDGVEGGRHNAKNEVDVLLVRGMVPVFISCKTGVPSALALSEIRLLSSKFGGSLSRTVLLTAARLGDEHKALRLRAADLNIALLDRSVSESGRLERVLTDLACPYPPPSPHLPTSL